MKRGMKTGVCVSCGRWSGRYYKSCPYCGERVWHALNWRLAAFAVLIVPLLATVLVVFFTRPSWAKGLRTVAVFPFWQAGLFASGWGLLVFPCGDRDLLLSSRRERIRWQVLAVAGALLCGAVAALTAFALRFGRAGGGWMWLLAGVAWLGAACAPLFFRIPWHALVGAALIAGTVLLGAAAYQA